MFCVKSRLSNDYRVDKLRKISNSERAIKKRESLELKFIFWINKDLVQNTEREFLTAFNSTLDFPSINLVR